MFIYFILFKQSGLFRI